ncbi:hypothetical protein VSQ32_10995 [Lachnospiraceae bacterium KK002]
MRKICSPAVLCLLLCFLAAAGCGNKNRTAGIQMTVLEFSGSLELKLEHFLPDGKVLLEQMPGGFDFSKRSRRLGNIFQPAYGRNFYGPVS